jgi:hypothetical protein
VSAKRGDRAAPPPRPGGFTIRFATNDAAKGWEELCRQTPSNLRTAYDAIESTPCPDPSTSRRHQLKGSLSSDTHAGQELPQWQYEVTAGGRIWYLVDVAKRICWIKFASTSHPKLTD